MGSGDQLYFNNSNGLWNFNSHYILNSTKDDDDFIIFIYLLIFGCIGSSLLCAGFSLVAGSGDYFVVVLGLLIAVASLVAEHGL